MAEHRSLEEHRSIEAESSLGSDVHCWVLHSVQYVHCCSLLLLKIFFNVLKNITLL